MEPFSLDLFSALDQGIAVWRPRFRWPVSYHWLLDLEQAVKTCFNRRIGAGRAPDFEELLLINYKLFFEFTALFHALTVLDKVRAGNGVPAAGEGSTVFRGLLENGRPRAPRMPSPGLPRAGLAWRLRRKAGLAAAFRRHGGGLLPRYLGGLLSRPGTIVLGEGLDALKLDHLERGTRGAFGVRYLPDWPASPVRGGPAADSDGGLAAWARALVEEACSSAETLGVPVTRGAAEYLTALTGRQFAGTLTVLRDLRRRAGREAPVHLLAGSGGNLCTRILSAVVRLAGGRVTSFHHGEPVIYDWDKPSWLELATTDHFLIHTAGLARELEAQSGAVRPPNHNRARIGSVGSPVFDRARNRLAGPVNREIRSVMVVGNIYSFDGAVGQGILFPDLMQLDWELRIIDELAKLGVRIFYKMHPGGKLAGRPAEFLGSGVTVLHQPFEECMEAADAFLFYHTRSTTFGPALCSPRPIIFLDGGWEDWLPGPRRLMEKRCRVVPARFDDRNRLVFEPEALRRAVALPAGGENQEYFEAYMSSGDKGAAG